jgi:hypothetical protein
MCRAIMKGGVMLIFVPIERKKSVKTARIGRPRAENACFLKIGNTDL